MIRTIAALSILALLTLAAACGTKTDTAKEIKTVPVGKLTVTISSPSGQLKHGGDEFVVTFKDASGKPVDVGAVSLTFHMPAMGPMAAMKNGRHRSRTKDRLEKARPRSQ